MLNVSFSLLSLTLKMLLNVMCSTCFRLEKRHRWFGNLILVICVPLVSVDPAERYDEDFIVPQAEQL
jgi:hypothetical protein